MRPTAGTALGGRYRLDRLIAVGGMGEVWVAHDLSLRRDVAVKVLREEFAGDPGFLERFRTEARNAASLSHPNIAATHDYGEQSGSSYLVMELVTGEPLSELLEREPVLPEQRLLPVLAQTARALHAAHQAGVVHRDVKPGNILLGAGGRVKITDFGVSTAPDQAPMTATGMVMGTAQYLSPEQAVGRPATASSDLYSLGIVAYEALVGHRPFSGPTAVDIAVSHVNDPVPRLPATVSRPVAALVMQLLAKDPADRPRSAAALARSLDALAGHTPPDGVAVDDAPPPATVGPPVTVRPPAAVGPPATVRPPVTVPPGTRPPGEGAPGHTGPPPPSFPPARVTRDPRGRAPGGTQAPTRTAVHDAGRAGTPGATATRPGTPVRTSTTTGRRLGHGRYSWPLVALLVLLLALLLSTVVSAIAGGGRGADGATQGVESAAVGGPALTVAPVTTVTSVTTATVTVSGAPHGRGGSAGAADDGMITRCVPTGPPGGTGLPTTKDA